VPEQPAPVVNNTISLPKTRRVVERNPKNGLITAISDEAA
jgi:hypothetical protein